MLVRADRKTADLKLFNAHGGTFKIECELPSGGPLGTLAVPRGWVAVDVKGRGTAFRLISTHLDTVCPPAVRHAQAQELLDGPALTPRPVVLVGDFNSPAGTSGESGQVYRDVLAAGFTDAALHTAIANVPTCCQDDHLLNPRSTLDRRIDFIFFQGPFRVRRAQVVGGDPADRTPSGLWPSDHAGVVVTLALPHP